MDVNYLYGWSVSPKLPVNGFKWVEDPSEINEEFINYNEEKQMEDIFWKIISWKFTWFS